MTDSAEARVLTHAVHRAQTRPEYLGWVLAQYRELEHLSESALAEFLGTTSNTIPGLSLCLRPRADHFVGDIQQISSQFTLDASKLAGIVRLVESVEAMTRSPQTVSSEAGLLMAARSRSKQRVGKRKKHSADDLPTT